jgi:hypothetical protein
MANDFIRVPPDSTGKRVRNEKSLDVVVQSIDLSILNALQISSLITSSTGGTGYFTGYKIDSRNVITIFLRDSLGDFTTGSTLSFSGSTFATITESVEIYTQKSHVVDKGNPDHSMKIDQAGAAYMRFAEGNATLDVFGNLKTTTTTIMKPFVFYYERNVGDFVDDISLGGSITEDTANSQIVLGTTTASGSRSVMTTYNYIPYIPQKSNTVVLSVSCGDGGKEGVVRRWGLFDDDDGIYFEQRLGGLSVNIKSSITGLVTSVPQNEFNGDRLLSDTFDTFELETEKYNLYWISYQWQGVGIVKFGLFSPSGDRLTMHTFQNPNKNVVPYMKTGTLPVRLEQYNEILTGSSSEMKTSCIVALRDDSEIQMIGPIKRYTTPSYITISDTPTPLISLRVSELVNGQKNKAIIVPYEFEYIVENNPVILSFVVNGTLVDADFTTYTPFSEIDISATGITGGLTIGANILNVGYSHEVPAQNLDFAVNNNGNQTHVTLVARTTKPGVTSSIFLIGKWREVI